MVFTEDEVEFLCGNKRYGAKRFLKEFPAKQWSLNGLNRIWKKIDERGSVERTKGAGWHTVTTSLNALSSCARVSSQKADTLNTNLVSSFRPLPAGHSYLFQ